MPAPSRGDIYYIDVPPEFRVEHEEFGPHWHVVVSSDDINHNLRIAVVVPLSSPLNKEGKPKDAGPYRNHRIKVIAGQITWYSGQKAAAGDSLAKTEQVFCLSRRYLESIPCCGKISDTGMSAIEAGLCHVLKIPIPKKLGGPVKPPLAQKTN